MKHTQLLLSIILGTFIMLQPYPANSQTSKPTLMPYLTKSGKFGYVDSNNKLTIPATFDFASPFVEGIAVADVGGKKGVIDTCGKWILKPKFDDVDLTQRANVVLIKTAIGKNAWVKFWKWKVLPNFSLFSSRIEGPFLVAKVPHSKQATYDESGHKLFSYREDESTSNSWKSEISDVSANIEPWEYANGYIFITTKKQAVKMYKRNENKLKPHKTLRNVFIILNEKEYVYYSAKEKIFIHCDIANKKNIHEKFTTVTEQKDICSGSFLLKKSDGSHLYYSTWTGFVEAPKQLNSDLSYRSIIPIPKSKGELFWAKATDTSEGIVTKEGEWLVKDSLFRIHSLHTNGYIAVANHKTKQKYMFDYKGNRYVLPEGTRDINEHTDGSCWILVNQQPNIEETYRIFDLEKGSWVSPRNAKYLNHISFNRFECIEKTINEEGYSQVSYHVVDDQLNHISTGDYRFISFTDDNRLLLVRERNSGKQFYIIVETGEELREKE